MHKGDAMSFNFFLYITKQNNLKKKKSNSVNANKQIKASNQMTEQENLHESAEGYGNELVTMSRGVSFNFVIFFSSLTLFFICCCCFDTRNPFFLPGCADSNVQCPEWAKLDECFNNPQWMKRNCRFSCEQCQEPQIEVRLWWPFFSLLSLVAG